MVAGSRGISTPLATGGTWTVDVDTAVIGGDLEKAIGKRGGKGRRLYHDLLLSINFPIFGAKEGFIFSYVRYSVCRTDV